MESRLAAITARMALRFFTGVPRHQSLRRGLATVFPTRRTADPHSGEPEGIDAEEAKAEAAEKQTEQKPSRENQPFVSPKPPYASSPQLESTAVNQPLDPNTQQKRRQNTKTAAEEVSCAGLDGTPWPDDGETGLSREQEEDNKEYFSHHKASPLSEIEVADTRKPITKATDGTADSNMGYFGGGGDVVLWREEQLDSAEDSLRRAVEIWRQAAMRGDPDSPHGRVLRELRGENW
ncbi:uncharacterized protein LOC127800730 [Diospyros lotus]|uniref:uncharacterized protein LOC127800730 n=1 Tax=Diospyros lotus TaxID=55363 RepID=UPI0022599C6A|nr:uncharacterized protein LOC127800730 [Diospyros lotus]